MISIELHQLPACLYSEVHLFDLLNKVGDENSHYDEELR